MEGNLSKGWIFVILALASGATVLFYEGDVRFWGWLFLTATYITNAVDVFERLPFEDRSHDIPKVAIDTPESLKKPVRPPDVIILGPGQPPSNLPTGEFKPFPRQKEASDKSQESHV